MKSVSLAIKCCLVLAILSAGCSKKDNNNAPSGDANTITITGMSFSPSTKTVAKGTVVKWLNNDGSAHTATSNDGTAFNSGNLSNGNSYSYTANTAGTFAYHCTIHGLAMSGTLIVNP